MRQILPILSFLCLSFYSHSQALTKNKVLNTLKKSIRQDTKQKVSIDSNPWVACNKDSAFFLEDTIRLYNNNSNIQSQCPNDCCNFVDWTFYKKKAFVQTRTQLCKEPATGSIPTTEDWFIISVIKYQNDIILESMNQGQIVSRYKVIGVDKVSDKQGKDKIQTIVLVRVK